MIDELFRPPLGLGASLFLAACAGPGPASTNKLQEPPASQTQAQDDLSLRFVEYIDAPQADVWAALTAPEKTRQFFHGTKVSTELKKGGVHNHLSGDGGRVVIDGRIRDVDAPNELTFEFRFPEYEDKATLVRYRLDDAGEGTTKLTVEHEGFAGSTKTFRRVIDGWPPVMSGLKTLLESGAPLKIPSFNTAASKQPPPDHPQHRFVAYIRTSPAALWTALTDPAWTAKYFHGYEVGGSFEPGGEIRYVADGSPMIEGEVVTVVAQEELEFSFVRASAKDEQPSRVRYAIEDLGDGVCRLIVVHDFESTSETYRRVAIGWPPILSGLKTLLESGEPLAIAKE